MTVLTPEFTGEGARTQLDQTEWVSPVLEPWRSRLRRRLRIREVGILTLVALGGYLWVGWWLRTDLHFFVNDALARTSDAIFVTVGRDPHLGAIGFYWPPIPQLIQTPFVPILVHFGRQDMAGPISSAICMALTIPVLGRLCTRLGLSRVMRFAICASFAINPVVIYYAANGMSEACSFLFISIAMLGFLNFIRTRATADLIVLSAGLSGAVLTRLEAPLLTVVLAGIAAFEWPRWRRALWTFALIVIPPAACFIFWMVVQWVLLGSPFFFLHTGQTGPGNNPIWLPNTQAHPFLVFPWGLHWALVLGPALAVAVLFLLWSPLSPTARGTIGILAGAGVFIAIQIETLLAGNGFGDPRYFVICVLFATIAVIWLAAVRPGALGQVWNCALVGVLLLGAITGSRSLTSGRITHVEKECNFFDYGAGGVLPILGQTYSKTSVSNCPRLGNQLVAWQKLDAALDRMITPHDRILADNDSNFYAVMFTRHPNQFIVRNDRDWQKIVANPIGIVTYIVTETTTGPAGVNTLPGGGIDEGRMIVDGNPSEWKVVASFTGGADFAAAQATLQIYKYVAPPSAGAQAVPEG
jgi:hypothetical protein